MKKVFIIHGFQASAQSHWFPWLKRKLEAIRVDCHVFNMTDSMHPDYLIWKQDLTQQLQYLDLDTIVIAHSLGCISVLDYLSSVLEHQKIKAFIGVSGFKEKLKSLPELNHFIEQTHLSDGILRLNIQQRYVIFSNNDQYVPAPLTICLGQRIKAQMVESKGAGHLLEEDRYREFPQLWELVQSILSA